MIAAPSARREADARSRRAARPRPPRRRRRTHIAHTRTHVTKELWRERLESRERQGGDEPSEKPSHARRRRTRRCTGESDEESERCIDSTDEERRAWDGYWRI